MRYLIIIVLLSGYITTAAQSNAILQHATVIKSIDPADEDFADLMPIIEKIGTSQLVALGEATHEDGLTFKAKTRLIKFLHQKMGFDVLLFESGMMSNWYMNTVIRTDSPMVQAIAYERGGWGNSIYTGYVFDYARQSWKTSRPLEMGGFDYDAGRMGGPVLIAFLNRLFSKIPALKPENNAWIIVDSLVRGFINFTQSSNLIMVKMPQASVDAGHVAIKKLIEKVETNKEACLRTMGKKEYELTVYFLHNLITDLESQFRRTINYRGGIFNGLEWNSKRDAAMADRIIWMMNNLYKGRKIILWGATGHFMKNSKGFITRGDTATAWEFYQAGDYLSKKLKNDYYVISFVCRQGERGEEYPDEKRNADYGSKHPVGERADDSFEQMAGKTGNPYLFFDLRSLPANHLFKKPAVAYAFGNSKDKTDWSKMIDAFFYIDTMGVEKKRY
jgi:erythromycin esterase